MPQRFNAGSSNFTISVTGDMIVNFPQAVMEEANLQVGQRYNLDFIPCQPLTIFFTPDEKGDYTMSYQGENADGYTGGKLTLRKFYKDVGMKRFETPLRDCRPIILPSSSYAIGVMLQEPAWLSLPLANADFAELNALPGQGYGVYQYLAFDGTVLKIGEGCLTKRLRQHIQNSWHDVHSARYLPIHYNDKDCEKADGSLLEKIFLHWYLDDEGELPKYNRIRR